MLTRQQKHHLVHNSIRPSEDMRRVGKSAIMEFPFSVSQELC